MGHEHALLRGPSSGSSLSNASSSSGAITEHVSGPEAAAVGAPAAKRFKHMGVWRVWGGGKFLGEGRQFFTTAAMIIPSDEAGRQQVLVHAGPCIRWHASSV